MISILVLLVLAGCDENETGETDSGNSNPPALDQPADPEPPATTPPSSEESENINEKALGILEFTLVPPADGDAARPVQFKVTNQSGRKIVGVWGVLSLHEPDKDEALCTTGYSSQDIERLPDTAWSFSMDLSMWPGDTFNAINDFTPYCSVDTIPHCGWAG
jgi:hypothetical protein